MTKPKTSTPSGGRRRSPSAPLAHAVHVRESTTGKDMLVRVESGEQDIRLRIAPRGQPAAEIVLDPETARSLAASITAAATRTPTRKRRASIDLELEESAARELFRGLYAVAEHVAAGGPISYQRAATQLGHALLLLGEALGERVIEPPG